MYTELYECKAEPKWGLLKFRSRFFFFLKGHVLVQTVSVSQEEHLKRIDILTALIIKMVD